jgi:hypothetical protein
MKKRSSSSRLIHSPILRCAAVALLAMGWSVPAFCDGIHDAAAAGDLIKVKALLQHNPALVFSKADKYYGATPLHLAAGWGHKDVAQLLLDFKAVVDARNNHGYTPLYVAARSGHKDVVELLLANGADVNAKDNDGQTPLGAVLSEISNHRLPDRLPGLEDVAELLRQHSGQDTSGQLNEAPSAPHKTHARPPTNAFEAVITTTVKRWLQDYDQEMYLHPEAHTHLGIFGQNMSVFVLKRKNDDFIASLDIPAADGQTSRTGVLIQARNQDPISGKQFTDIFLSGLVWTPRAGAIGQLDLTGSCSITTSPEFTFEAFKDSPAVIPFANGYAVNLFGQKLDEQGLVDVHTDHKNNYVSDDGRPLYGRLVRSHSGKLEEIVLAPAAGLPCQNGGQDASTQTQPSPAAASATGEIHDAARKGDLARVQARLQSHSVEGDNATVETPEEKNFPRKDNGAVVKDIERDGRFIAYDNGTVLDTKTNVVWAASDNGVALSWPDAKAYCESYRGGGYTDWRLPTREELVGLYDATKSYRLPAVAGDNRVGGPYDVSEVHLTKLIHLTGSSAWSSEFDNSIGSARIFSFHFGSALWRPQFKTFVDADGRALAVRSGPLTAQGQQGSAVKTGSLAYTRVTLRNGALVLKDVHDSYEGDGWIAGTVLSVNTGALVVSVPDGLFLPSKKKEYPVTVDEKTSVCIDQNPVVSLIAVSGLKSGQRVSVAFRKGTRTADSIVDQSYEVVGRMETPLSAAPTRPSMPQCD